MTRSVFAFIHGAGDVGWYWDVVEAELLERGHDVVAPDLPCDDDAAGLAEYADAVVVCWAGTGPISWSSAGPSGPSSPRSSANGLRST